MTNGSVLSGRTRISVKDVVSVTCGLNCLYDCSRPVRAIYPKQLLSLRTSRNSAPKWHLLLKMTERLQGINAPLRYFSPSAERRTQTTLVPHTLILVRHPMRSSVPLEPIRILNSVRPATVSEAITLTPGIATLA